MLRERRWKDLGLLAGFVLFVLITAGCQRLDPWSNSTATVEPTVTPTPTETPTPVPTPTSTSTPTPTPRGHLQAIVILHGPSRFFQVDRILAKNDVSSVAIEAYAGQPIPDLTAYDAVILSGGEYAPSQFDQVAFLQEERERVVAAIEKGVPVFGICLGHQLLAHWLGGRVEPSPNFEVGWLEVSASEQGLEDPLLDGIDQPFYAFLWHGDQVTELPPGARNLASSDLCTVQVFRYRDLPVWGVQFNPQYDAALAKSALLGAEWLARVGVNAEEMAQFGYEADDGTQERIFSNFFAFVRRWRPPD